MANINKPVFGFIGRSCWYYVKAKNEKGHNILRPPFDAEIDSNDLADTGKFYDMVFYTETKKELEVIARNSGWIAVHGYQEERFKYLKSPPFYIPAEYLYGVQGCQFFLNMTNTSIIWDLK